MRRLNSVPSMSQPQFHFTAPPPQGYDTLLCQRTQGCMKAANHTGFCSGHKGFKRKTSSTGGGHDGGGGYAERISPVRKKPAPKRRAPAALKDDGALLPQCKSLRRRPLRH